MRRIVYLALFTILGGMAAVLTLKAQHTIPVVVAAHDLRAGAQVQSGDVEVRNLHSDALPDGTVASADQATGRYVTWPLTAGEPVLARTLAATPTGTALVNGLEVPAGYRAIAVPVQPAAAVGGVLSPGDRVDVFATPQQGRGAAVAAAPGATPAAGTASGTDSAAVSQSPTVQLGRSILVLQLRSDQGASLQQSDSGGVHGLNFGAGKLGSVVLAVPADQVDRYASAAANDTVYLALTVS